jgi:protein-L-isoaspartate(D-aspartate) O-methyltransferase
MYEDTPMHQGLRRKLVEQIEEKGIRDRLVLKAIGDVPRHLFMDSTFLKFAYTDQAFPIAAGQTISQPYTVARQTELLEMAPHLKVLEIGTGSGYQAAILASMKARVYTIERVKSLHSSASLLLPKLGLPVKFFFGDGYKGLPAFAPFDRILITAAVQEIPEDLKNQLSLGGILVAPVGSRNSQVMTRLIKKEEDEFTTSHHGSFVFVPMLSGKVD